MRSRTGQKDRGGIVRNRHQTGNSFWILDTSPDLLSSPLHDGYAAETSEICLVLP